MRAGLLLLFMACNSKEPSASSNFWRHWIYREASREIVRTHCGGCHEPEHENAKLAALDVFNLSNPEWDSSLKQAQRTNLVWRLSLDLAPGGTDGISLDVPQTQQTAVSRYLQRFK